ncbi:unnamed protein product [Leuciscus chuanchicus]
MARRHAVVQAFQVDPESDPDGEATDEEVATQRLQQDVSEWTFQRDLMEENEESEKMSEVKEESEELSEVEGEVMSEVKEESEELSEVEGEVMSEVKEESEELSEVKEEREELREVKEESEELSEMKEEREELSEVEEEHHVKPGKSFTTKQNTHEDPYSAETTSSQSEITKRTAVCFSAGLSLLRMIERDELKEHQKIHPVKTFGGKVQELKKRP